MGLSEGDFFDAQGAARNVGETTAAGHGTFENAAFEGADEEAQEQRYLEGKPVVGELGPDGEVIEDCGQGPSAGVGDLPGAGGFDEAVGLGKDIIDGGEVEGAAGGRRGICGIHGRIVAGARERRNGQGCAQASGPGREAMAVSMRRRERRIPIMVRTSPRSRP